MGREEDLVFYAAVVHKNTIIAAHSNFREDYMGSIAEAMRQLPPHLSHYTRSYDGAMIAFYIEKGVVYTLGAHEALGKARAFRFLKQVRDLHHSAATKGSAFVISQLWDPSNSLLHKLSSKIKSLMATCRGKIPPVKELQVYPDAPWAYIPGRNADKEKDAGLVDKSPRAMQNQKMSRTFSGKGKTRLQLALDAVDMDEEDDDEDDDDEEDFVWNPKVPNPLSDCGESPESSPRPAWAKEIDSLRLSGGVESSDEGSEEEEKRQLKEGRSGMFREVMFAKSPKMQRNSSARRRASPSEMIPWGMTWSQELERTSRGLDARLDPQLEGRVDPRMDMSLDGKLDARKRDSRLQGALFAGGNNIFLKDRLAASENYFRSSSLNDRPAGDKEMAFLKKLRSLDEKKSGHFRSTSIGNDSLMFSDLSRWDKDPFQGPRGGKEHGWLSSSKAAFPSSLSTSWALERTKGEEKDLNLNLALGPPSRHGHKKKNPDVELPLLSKISKSMSLDYSMLMERQRRDPLDVQDTLYESSDDAGASPLSSRRSILSTGLLSARGPSKPKPFADHLYGDGDVTAILSPRARRDKKVIGGSSSSSRKSPLAFAAEDLSKLKSKEKAKPFRSASIETESPWKWSQSADFSALAVNHARALDLLEPSALGGKREQRRKTREGSSTRSSSSRSSSKTGSGANDPSWEASASKLLAHPGKPSQGDDDVDADVIDKPRRVSSIGKQKGAGDVEAGGLRRSQGELTPRSRRTAGREHKRRTRSTRKPTAENGEDFEALETQRSVGERRSSRASTNPANRVAVSGISFSEEITATRKRDKDKQKGNDAVGNLRSERASERSKAKGAAASHGPADLRTFGKSKTTGRIDDTSRLNGERGQIRSVHETLKEKGPDRRQRGRDSGSFADDEAAGEQIIDVHKSAEFAPTGMPLVYRRTWTNDFSRAPLPNPAAKKVRSDGIVRIGDPVVAERRLYNVDEKVAEMEAGEDATVATEASKAKPGRSSSRKEKDKVVGLAVEKKKKREGGRKEQSKDRKLRGTVGETAPSGLSWDQEIAAKLAASGVTIKTRQSSKEDEDSGEGSASDKSSGSDASAPPEQCEPKSPKLMGAKMPPLERVSEEHAMAMSNSGEVHSAAAVETQVGAVGSGASVGGAGGKEAKVLETVTEKPSILELEVHAVEPVSFEGWGSKDQKAKQANNCGVPSGSPYSSSIRPISDGGSGELGTNPSKNRDAPSCCTIL